jgi:UPF0755 protein
MNRIVVRTLLLLALAGLLGGYFLLRPATIFQNSSRYLLIEPGKTDAHAVCQALEDQGILRNSTLFSWTGSGIGLWSKIKPGRYEIRRGYSLLRIARLLKNGRQATVNLVITGIRTKENFARLVAKNFAMDSASVMRFLNSPDSLKPYNVDTSTVFTMILPDTYNFYWNTSLSRIFQRLAEGHHEFWQKNDRMAKAEKIGLSPEQVYTLASIVEEETNYDSDKYKIASVYLNRLHKNMPLQACPTIKYAMHDFTLTRIYDKYLSNPSPYNTYRHKGLPPGPICIPSKKTIDIVLNAPVTDYLFFVAKSDFSGYHHFSSDYKEHSKYAKEYQKALDVYMARKQQNTSQP